MVNDKKDIWKKRKRQTNVSGRKRSFGGNQSTLDKDKEETWTAAKKLKQQNHPDLAVSVDPAISYVFI